MWCLAGRGCELGGCSWGQLDVSLSAALDDGVDGSKVVGYNCSVVGGWVGRQVCVWGGVLGMGVGWLGGCVMWVGGFVSGWVAVWHKGWKSNAALISCSCPTRPRPSKNRKLPNSPTLQKHAQKPSTSSPLLFFPPTQMILCLTRHQLALQRRCLVTP